MEGMLRSICLVNSSPELESGKSRDIYRDTPPFGRNIRRPTRGPSEYTELNKAEHTTWKTKMAAPIVH